MATRGPEVTSTGSSRLDSAPLGIKIICVLAGLVTMYTLFLSLVIVGHGSEFAGLGWLLAAVSIGQLLVLYGLWTLESWGWTWALVLYGLGAMIALVRIDVVGLIVSAAIFLYIASKEEYYR